MHKLLNKKFCFFFITFVIIALNYYLGRHLKFPLASDHWDIVHFPLESTSLNFYESLVWEHTGVPGFRLLIYFLQKFSILINFNSTIIYTFIFLISFIALTYQILNNLKKLSSIIIFYLFIVTSPFYLLTVVWPFHSGIVVLLLLLGCYILLKNPNDYSSLFINIYLLILSFSGYFWALFNFSFLASAFLLLIFFQLYFYKFSYLKFNYKYFSIGLIAVLLSLIIPIKNYSVYGWFTPVSLSGFAKANSIWTWVSEEKRISLVEQGDMNQILFEFISRDFNGLNHPTLAKNDRLHKIVLDYIKSHQLEWSIDSEWKYIDKNGVRIDFLNNLFSNPNYIDKREPAAVALFSFLNNSGNNIAPLYVKDQELKRAFLASLFTRVTTPLTAPSLYYKHYPIFGGWDRTSRTSFPTKDFYLLDYGMFSNFSLISIFILIFSTLYLFTSIVFRNLLSFRAGTLCISLFAFLISAVLKVNFFSFFSAFFVLIFVIFLGVLISYTRGIDNRKLRIPIYYATILFSLFLILFLGICYSTISEGLRYFGIILIIPVTALLLVNENQ